MESYQVYKVELDTYRGLPVTKVYFSGEGEHQQGEILKPKDLIAKILKHDTFLVMFTGGEPTLQNMRDIIGLTYYLRRRFKKRIIFETDASRFNQLLFINVKHFLVCPKREKYNPNKFKRYIENATYKSLYKGRTDNWTTAKRKNYKTWTKFVELQFNMRDSEDWNFAEQIFNDYPGIVEQKIKIYITHKPSDEYTKDSFVKDWQAHYDFWKKYPYTYFIE